MFYFELAFNFIPNRDLKFKQVIEEKIMQYFKMYL